MVNKKVDGCHNCKHAMGTQCEETFEYIDMWFQENMGESMCNFEYWEHE